jgi:hypothetical protein
MMNNKSGVGWHEFVAQSNVRRKNVSFVHGCQNLRKLINFLILTAVFFQKIFIFTFTHNVSLCCVYECFWCEKQSKIWGVKKFWVNLILPLDGLSDDKREEKKNAKIGIIGLQLRSALHDTTAWNRKQMSSLFSYLSLRGLWLEKLSSGEENCYDILTVVSYLIYLHILRNFFHFPFFSSS